MLPSRDALGFDSPVDDFFDRVLVNADDAAVRQNRLRLLSRVQGAMGQVADFSQVGINLQMLRPGEPMAMYHWEADQEDFLVVAGEALLIVEGQERPLRQWDLAHCPPGTEHTIIGAGDAGCVVVAVGARDRSTGSEWGAYTVADAAHRHNAGVDQETTEPEQAYARFGASAWTQYQEGWLPD